MRSRNSLIWAGIVTVLVASAAMWGCSDDDPAPTTTNVIVDEDRSIETMLEEVSAQVNTYMDTATSVLAAGLRVATYSDIGTGWGDLFLGGGTPDSLDNSNDWIVAWSTDLQAGVGSMYNIDSITYLVGGVIGTTANGADQMYLRHHYTFQPDDTTATSSDVANHGDFIIQGIDGNTATINGTLSTNVCDKVVDPDLTTWSIWDIETTLNDVTVTKTGDAWTNGCPNGGSCTVEVEYTYAENLDVPMTTSWLFDITLTDGSMDVDVTIGNLAADYQYDLCTIQ